MVARVTHSEAQEADSLAGLHDGTIHSTVLGGGEIRSQLLGVPERGADALLTGLGPRGWSSPQRFKRA